MAPKFDVLGKLGSGMGNYFKYNFGGFPVGLPAYSAARSAGMNANAAFGTSILSTAAFSHASNQALAARDREQRTPAFEFQPLDTAYQYSIEALLGNQGRKPYSYYQYETNVSKNKLPEKQRLNEDEFNRWRDREKKGGWIARIDAPGESEIKDRATLTLFGRTFANPYDNPTLRESLGDEGVDRLTAATGVTALGVSASTLKPLAPLAGASSITASQFRKAFVGSSLKGLGVAGSILAGVQDYGESIEAGDSKLRAGVNAASSTTGSLAAASVAASTAAPLLAFGPAGWIGYAGIVGASAIAGQFAGGYASDRVLDVAGEGKQFNRKSISQPFSDLTSQVSGIDIKKLDYSQTEEDEMATPRKNQSRTLSRRSGRTPEQLDAIDREKINANQYVGLDQNRISGVVGLDKNQKDYSATIDRNTRQQEEQRYKTLADYQKDVYGINVKSGDTRYGINVDADTKRGLGIANIQSDERTSKYKTDVGANVEKFKHTTVDETKRFQQTTVNQTELAKAKVAASPEDYMSQDTLSRRVNDQRRAQNYAIDQRNLENRLKVAEFNAKQADKPDRFQERIDKQNARSAAQSEASMNRAMEAAKARDAYAKEARDRFYQQQQYQDAKGRYEQERQDKSNQNMQARQDYAAQRQDYMGAQAYDRFDAAQRRTDRLKEYEDEMRLKKEKMAQENSLRRMEYESKVSAMKANIGLEQQKFDFTKQQYGDLQQSRAAATALATRARAVVGSGY